MTGSAVIFLARFSSLPPDAPVTSNVVPTESRKTRVYFFDESSWDSAVNGLDDVEAVDDATVEEAESFDEAGVDIDMDSRFEILKETRLRYPPDVSISFPSHSTKLTSRSDRGKCDDEYKSITKKVQVMVAGHKKPILVDPERYRWKKVVEPILTDSLSHDVVYKKDQLAFDPTLPSNPPSTSFESFDFINFITTSSSLLRIPLDFGTDHDL